MNIIIEQILSLKFAEMLIKFEILLENELLLTNATMYFGKTIKYNRNHIETIEYPHEICFLIYKVFYLSVMNVQ